MPSPNPVLVAFLATSFTGGAASTSHVLNTSASTQIGDLLCLVVYLGNNSPALTTPAGWTLINTVSADGILAGTFASYYKKSTVNGTEAVNVVSSVGAFGCGAVATIRGQDDTPLEQFSFGDAYANTYTAPSVTVSNWDSVVVVGAADDTTLETWSTSPSLTQKAVAFASEVSQLVCYYDNLPVGGASPAYALTKTAPTVGSVVTVTPAAAGASYTAGDTFTIPGGNGAAGGTINTVDGAGHVTSFTLTAPGRGYSTGGPFATAGGTGTGFTVNITAITSSGIAQAIYFRQLPLAVSNPTHFGHLGVPYSSTVSGSGGTPPYTYSITAGSLPTGLSLDGATGIISGTPTAAGTFTFTLTVTDSQGQTLGSSKTIVILPPIVNTGPCVPHRVFLADDTLTAAIIPVTGGHGTFEYGSAKFCIAITTVVDVSGNLIRDQLDVYVSTDGGLTFTAADAANSPIKETSGHILSEGTSPYWTPGGRFLSFVWPDTMTLSIASAAFAQFDLQTRTWGAKITGGPTIIYPFPSELWLRSDGSWVYTFTIGAGGLGMSNPFQVYLVTLTGAVWSAPQRIDDVFVGGAFGLASVLDSSDRLHFVYNEGTGFPAVVHYRNWLGGVLSASQVITPPDGGYLFSLLGLYVPATDEVFFGFVCQLAALGEYAFRGTPSTAPVFTLQTVALGTVAEVQGPPIMRLFGNTVFYAVVLQDTSSTTTEGLIYYTQTVGSGTWGNRTVLWEWALKPPIPDPGTNVLEVFFFFDLQSNGDITAAIGTLTVFEEGGFCALMYFLWCPRVTPRKSLPQFIKGGINRMAG